ncbi:MAG: hypothetical protein V7776_09325 [Halopseudomonas aestusnigri]
MFSLVSIFLLLAFIRGDIGKAMKVVPIVLIMTLVVSLIEGLRYLAAPYGAFDRPPG